MSTEKNAKKNKNFFQRMGSGIAKWFREMRSELRKVVWPTSKQIVNNSAVALAVIAIFAIVLWGFDEISTSGIKALISFGG